MTEVVRMNDMFGSLHGDIDNPFMKEELRLNNGKML